MKTIRLITLFCLVVVLPQRSFAFDLDGGRPAMLNGMVNQARPGGSDLVALPTARRLSGQWDLETGWSRQYNLPEFDHLYLATGYRYRAVSVSFGFAQFGDAELYSERTVRAGLAVRRSPVSAGLIYSYRILAFDERFPSLDAATAGLCASLDLAQLLLSAEADNLTRPTFHAAGRRTPRIGRLHVQYVSERDFSLLGTFALDEDRPPRITIGQTIDFVEQAGILWSATNKPWMYGGGLQFSWQGTTLCYAVSYHPTLGVTHFISLGLALRPRKAD